MIQVIHTFRNSKISLQGIIAIACLGLYFLSSFFLEKSYAASKFPVPYFQQQTSFDAVSMKEWYSFMIQENTFNIYLRTQFIDFIFIAAVIAAGFSLWTFISSLHKKGSFFQRIGYKMAFALPLAGAFDVLENLVSFFMIANPTDFSDAWIIPYSSFAVLKFGCWTIALAWVVVSLLALPFTFLFKKERE